MAAKNKMKELPREMSPLFLLKEKAGLKIFKFYIFYLKKEVNYSKKITFYKHKKKEGATAKLFILKSWYLPGI